MFTTVFDASTQGYAWWWLIIPACLVLILAAIFLQRKRLASRLPLRFRAWGLLLSLFALAFAALVSTCAFIGSYSSYSAAQALLRNGDTKIVEGIVENYTPQPAFDNGVESFTVDGVK